RSFHEEKAIQREQRKRQRQITELENQITELEIELEHLEEKMTQPDVFQDHEKSLELSTEAKHIKNEMEQLINTWEELHSDKKLGTQQVIFIQTDIQKETTLAFTYI